MIDHQLQITITALQALQERVHIYDDLEERLATLEAQLTSLETAHSVIEGKLSNSRKLLDDKQHAALQTYEKSIYDKTLTLRELMSQIETAKTTLDGLRTSITAAKAEHNSIQSSIDGMKKRFA